MNFTREPIIETVITPKEGCKLVVRNSKGVGQEDYFVDAIEVVSFGSSHFFRSTERPKSFLVPVSDYEIIELKETRMVLKSAALEKNIKIGGGKEPSRIEESEEKAKKEEGKRKDKKRLRKRKITPPKSEIESKEKKPKEGGDTYDETIDVSSSTIRVYIPPPNILIKEKLNRKKGEENLEKNILPVELEKKVEEVISKKEEPKVPEKLEIKHREDKGKEEPKKKTESEEKNELDSNSEKS